MVMIPGADELKESLSRLAETQRKDGAPNRADDVDQIMSFLISLDDRVTALESPE